MLADFIELGARGLCFSLRGGSEALYPSNVLIHAQLISARVYVLTVVPNISAELYVSKPLGLGGYKEALGDCISK